MFVLNLLRGFYHRSPSRRSYILLALIDFSEHHEVLWLNIAYSRGNRSKLIWSCLLLMYYLAFSKIPTVPKIIRQGLTMSTFRFHAL